MILLDKPLISDFVKDSIRAGMFSALDTGNMIMPGELDLLSDEEAIRMIRSGQATNLHTTSENALKWVYENLEFTGLPEKVRLFKDKYAFRELTADMYPGLFYKKVFLEELDNLDFNTLPLPFIIKPSTGFFSMGIYKVFDEKGWEETKQAIRRDEKHISSIYPDEVLGLGSYIIEEVIAGEEYAFDAYFNDDGKAHVLGVLKHPFSGEIDVSDRVYNTSADIVRSNLNHFNNFLNEIGKRADLRNFSLHTEVRIDTGGYLTPIEVNPLRFGAWCTSADLSHYAFGINPYSIYINKEVPDWRSILSNADDNIYSIVILDNTTGYPAGRIKGFDYEKLLRKFENPMEIRKIDYTHYPMFAILFVCSRPDNYAEIESILHSDLKEFVMV